MLVKKFVLSFCCLIGASIISGAQTLPLSDFNDCVRKVDTLMWDHSGASGHLSLSKVVRSGSNLDVHFSASISDYPLRPGDASFLRSALKANLPEQYSNLKIRSVYMKNESLDKLVVPTPGNNGNPATSKLKAIDKRGPAIVKYKRFSAPGGLEGRHIALWQSHGRYYWYAGDKWLWQRATTFQTVEDLFTQSFVVPFLVPMLENAGAYVLLPRERDFHDCEIIIDNDPAEETSGRIHGSVEVGSKWKTADGAGFSDTRSYYVDEENPFTMGTALKCACTTKKAKEEKACWRARIPERGEYAVYVSYVTLPKKKSTSAARYTVHTISGDVPVVVNQRMGGGTWVYVGTYEFDKGESCVVSLSNMAEAEGCYVTADAVKIGGGMGCCARSNSDTTALTTSCVPRFAEGARYYMQWSGFPAKVWSQNKLSEDYRDDFMSRGKWVQYLCGGSWANPDSTGLNIPVDLSMAFHTDAGTKKDSTIVGTLSIYTLKCDGKTKLPSGGSRHTCRELADFMQTEIVDDIRAQWNPYWRRRMLWNRSYSESRTTGVPAVLLELLSHQNFEDMKYGLDPAFRFSVSRSCYKAILKYLSMHYGCPYVVQPLPVGDFKAVLNPDESAAILGWKETPDTLEPTANPDSYIVYTRIDGRGWDKGVKTASRSINIPIEKGHIYSFKVVAANKGGLSFPSEILSVGAAAESKGRVMVVNNFTRISGPVWFDTPTYAGFDNRTDSGVPYKTDWNFIGEQFEYRRDIEFDSNVNAGFGASHEDYSLKVVGGNTFDYPYVHGRSLMNIGYSFSSCSCDAFCEDASCADGYSVLDLICGKQCTVRTAINSPVRYSVFPVKLQDAIRKSADAGRHIIVSGSYIAADAWNGVYPQTVTDSLKKERENTREFIKKTLGYSLRRSYASRTGEVAALDGTTGLLRYPSAPCRESYCVESPDALYSLNLGSQIYMTYCDTGLPAGVRCDFGTYRVAAFGFPLEILNEKAGLDRVLSETMKFFAK